ncbi:MAG: hypothetical protein ACE5JN_05920 [Candidatus Methylomirabilia bacterium]
MAAVTLIIAVVALVIAILAFVRSGGIKDVRRQVEFMSGKTETARDRTADVLDRLERFIRGKDKSEGEQGPGGSSTAE